MIQLAVFGEPIRHSLSPQIHQQFAEQAGLRIDYRRILTPPEQLTKNFQRFVKEGGVGANITLPLKELPLTLADELDPLVQQTGACNTVGGAGQDWLGSNTACGALLKDLQRLSAPRSGVRLLLRRTGGGAPRVAAPRVAAGRDHLHVVNRTPYRAEQ